LPVKELADDNCVLFLWCVDWGLEAALSVIQDWGFEFKAVAFTWVKQNRNGQGLFTGMGYWTRSNPEMCLLATKGKPKRLDTNVHQVVLAPVSKHSRKPDEVYERIERLVDGPRLELYARRRRPGWTSWGNEIERAGASATPVDNLSLQPGAHADSASPIAADPVAEIEEVNRT